MQSKSDGANTLSAPSSATNLFISYNDIASVSVGDTLVLRVRNLRKSAVQQISIRLDALDVHLSLVPLQMRQSTTLDSKIAIAAERKQSTLSGCITAVSEGDVLQAPSRNIRI